MMRSQGDIGVVAVDVEAGVIRGKVINTRDSVGEYLEYCAARGEVSAPSS